MSTGRKVLKWVSISIGALFAVLITYSLILAGIHSSQPPGSSPVTPGATGPDLRLSCQLGYVGSDAGYNIIPSTFTTVEPVNEGYNPAVEVTATNNNPVMVAAVSVNVNLYDADGDLLSTTTVGLGLQAIAPGVTVTDVAINIEAPSAVSCKPTTYYSGR